MPITSIKGSLPSPQRRNAAAVDLVAIHDINEDAIQTWIDPITTTFWLKDLLPEDIRVLLYSYNAAPFTSPGVHSSQSILAHAINLVAELYADRQLENACDRALIFVCHGFGGLLLKRALSYSSSRDTQAVQHLRTIYTCTYGIIFMGTPHNGISKESLLSRGSAPNHFMLSLLQGSEMLNEINDQFAPLMKHFAIFNFWEEIETQYRGSNFLVVDQKSAAPAWDNVEKCGIVATHSAMIKFEGLSDRKFRPVLEAVSRYAKNAPALIKQRCSRDAELMEEKLQQTIDELSRSQHYVPFQLEATPPELNEWCLIPRKSSSYFTGRQKHATIVRNMLGSVEMHNDHKETRSLVIYGLGGSGKTQFCLKYVEDNKHRYWGVFWVDASSAENVESGYALIGAQAGRGATKASAIHWLSQSRRPWLLVLDNVDDPEVDISEYYPSEGNGHVLITTRNPNAIERATAGHLRFRGMDPPEAVTLLLKAAYPEQKHSSTPMSPMRNTLAEGVAVELGYLPLAIAHAGATIRRNIYTLERYLKYYLPQRKSMLSHSQVLSVDEANIITTWEIPFQKIISRVTTEHRDAVDLMHTFAFMHHETIPERIFQRSWVEIRNKSSSSALCPDILQSVWNEGAQARFRRAIAILHDHSIIEYEPSEGLCTMHPVVHNWARARLSDTDQRRWLKCTTSILAQCISLHLEVSGRRFRALLLPHINACLELRHSQGSRDWNSLTGAAEMERFACVYAENGQWKTARELQERVVSIRKEWLGQRNEATIRAQNSLGQTLWNLFEFEAAGEIQRVILNVLRWHRPQFHDWMIWPVWLPTHTSYCLALSEVTSILWLAGNRTMSRYTGERAVAGLTARLGPEDPLTLKAMFHLARTYLHLGEQEKCHKLLLWILVRQKRFFGLRHPDTLMTRNELGMLLCAGRMHLAAAQKLVENVLETRKQLLGEEHAYTLWSINDLSKIYVEVGRVDDAVAILEDIVPVVERTLGKNHVGMSMTKSNLGRAYFMSQRWKEAEEIVGPLLAKIPLSHPDWVHTTYGYAHILYELGRLDESEQFCIKATDRIDEARIFPKNHPRTVAIRQLLIKIYQHQGREDKFVALKKKCLTDGVMELRNWFDPYAIRRTSFQPVHNNQPPNYHDSADTAVAITHDTQDLPRSRSQLPSQDPYPKLVARRTF